MAVSGGVDSMTMLDIFWNCDDIMVAHFDHGTRESARTDAEFVKRQSWEKGLEIAMGASQLGENISEEVARESRYRFLREVATEQKAEIYTAHHLDDLVESVAINILRGTGWRGLAVLDAAGVRRPFLEPELLPAAMLEETLDEPWDKQAVLRYAAEHRVIFREDPTNGSDNYLRNRLRPKLRSFKQKRTIYELWQRQKALKREIDALVAEILPAPGEAWERAWFTNMDKKVALELLRAGTLRAGVSATRPQLEKFYQAILDYAPGKYFNLPGDVLVKIGKTEFAL